MVGAARSRLLGIFVDDWRFAGAIVLWLAISSLVLRRLGLPRTAPPVLLFAGLAIILMLGARRSARQIAAHQAKPR